MKPSQTKKRQTICNKRHTELQVEETKKRNNALYIIVKTHDIQRKKKIIIEIHQRKTQVKHKDKHKNSYKKTFFNSS